MTINVWASADKTSLDLDGTGLRWHFKSYISNTRGLRQSWYI